MSWLLVTSVCPTVDAEDEGSGDRLGDVPCEVSISCGWLARTIATEVFGGTEAAAAAEERRCLSVLRGRVSRRSTLELPLMNVHSDGTPALVQA